jgi:hypothetical protein
MNHTSSFVAFEIKVTTTKEEKNPNHKKQKIKVLDSLYKNYYRDKHT